MTPLPDPYAELHRAVLRTAATAPGTSPPELRAAAFAGRGLPADLQPLVDTIRAHAWKVTDGDVAPLAAARGDDAMFELIVNAALGAADARLQAGLKALEDA